MMRSLLPNHPKVRVFVYMTLGVLFGTAVDAFQGVGPAWGPAIVVLASAASALLLAHWVELEGDKPDTRGIPPARMPGPPFARMQMNPPSQLPPVDCPLVIEVNGQLLRAERTSFVQSRDQALTYRLADGTEITGQFRWTYP